MFKELNSIILEYLLLKNLDLEITEYYEDIIWDLDKYIFNKPRKYTSLEEVFYTDKSNKVYWITQNYLHELSNIKIEIYNKIRDLEDKAISLIKDYLKENNLNLDTKKIFNKIVLLVDFSNDLFNPEEAVKQMLEEIKRRGEE
ncbi:MAG: hypothetical protein ACPL1F_03135 [bacterium]